VPFLDVERKFYEKQWGLEDEVHWTMAEAFNYALDSYVDYETFGAPYSGGSMAQSVYWKMAVRCITEAKRRANEDKEAEREASAQRGGPLPDDY
jgi:hypothetical protein